MCKGCSIWFYFVDDIFCFVRICGPFFLFSLAILFVHTFTWNIVCKPIVCRVCVCVWTYRGNNGRKTKDQNNRTKHQWKGKTTQCQCDECQIKIIENRFVRVVREGKRCIRLNEMVIIKYELEQSYTPKAFLLKLCRCARHIINIVFDVSSGIRSPFRFLFREYVGDGCVAMAATVESTECVEPSSCVAFEWDFSSDAQCVSVFCHRQPSFILIISYVMNWWTQAGWNVKSWLRIYGR